MTYKEQVESLIVDTLAFSKGIEECVDDIGSIRNSLSSLSKDSCHVQEIKEVSRSSSSIEDTKLYSMLDEDTVPDAVIQFFNAIGGVPRWWNKKLTPIEEIDEECCDASTDNTQLSADNMRDAHLNVKNSDICIPVKESLSELDYMKDDCDTYSKSRLSGYTLTYPSKYRIPNDHPISGWSDERKERYVRGVIAHARQYSYNKFMRNPICAAYDCAECDCDIDLLLYNKSRWLYKTWFSLRGEHGPEMQFYVYYGIYDYGR